MYNYFPWPSNMRTADHILTMRIQEGSAGYGVYVMLLELLRDAENRSLVFNPRNLAFAINEPDIELVSRVIREYDLFTMDDSGKFSSPFLESQMAEYEASKEAAREAGRRGAAKRYGRALPGAASNDSTPIVPLNPPPSVPHSNKTNVILSNEKNQSRSKLLGMSWGDMDGEALYTLARGARTDIDSITREWARGKQKELDEQRGRDTHNIEAILDVCDYFHIGQEMFIFLLKYTNLGQVDRPPLVKLLRIRAEAQETKFVPKYPSEYVLVKLLEP